MDRLLEVEGLSVSYRSGARTVRAVDGVSFVLSRGETFCLVGESGCGKSTAALALTRLIADPPGKIEGGSVRLNGRDLLSLSESDLRSVRGREIAMVFQEPMTALNPVLTVGEQIAEGLRIHRSMDRASAKEESVSMMEAVGIPAPTDRYDDHPHQLSGGLRQRAMIAMALVCGPSVLVADEPTSALDVTIQAQILDLLTRLQAEKAMGLLLITHDLGVVAEVADRVAVMYAGAIVETAPVSELFARPLHPYTQALHRSLPKPGGASDARLETIPGRVPSFHDAPTFCRFCDRCPMVSTDCRAGEPALREVQPGHFVRCVYA